MKKKKKKMLWKQQRIKFNSTQISGEEMVILNGGKKKTSPTSETSKKKKKKRKRNDPNFHVPHSEIKWCTSMGDKLLVYQIYPISSYAKHIKINIHKITQHWGDLALNKSFN